MKLSKCDACQRQYDPKHEHVCQPMHYRKLEPPSPLTTESLGRASSELAKSCCEPWLLYLYVHPQDLRAAVDVAWSRIDYDGGWVNVLPRPGLKRGEWVASANGDFVGSEGV